MRELKFFVFVIMLLLSRTLRAEEGMWLLPLIEKVNMSDMQKLGIQLSAEDIYSINKSSIKDAVVIFGPGCTGEIVSPNGLIFTNHHCGNDYIQNHSTIKNNYLEDGFWADSLSDELPNPGLEVRILQSIEEVTQQVLNGVSDSLSLEERKARIRDTVKNIEKSIADTASIEAQVLPFYAGNAYYLFIYKVYKDIRLVGAPPSSIGNFGNESDNWEWPRHTGDFSIFRIYTAPDGSSAEFSEDNIPFKPSVYFPISLKGFSDGDPTIILGYPGSTNRYSTSSEVQQMKDIINVNRIAIRTARQEILNEAIKSDPEIKIKYNEKYALSSNYWKYSIGQNRGIETNNIIESKKKEEAAFRQWVANDSARVDIYGNIIEEIDTYYRNKSSNELNLVSLQESFFISTELLGFVVEFQYLYMILQTGYSKEMQADEIKRLKELTSKFFTEYDAATDKSVAKSMFKLYPQLVPINQQPEIYEKYIVKKYKRDIDKFVDNLYENTMFLNPSKIQKFLENPNYFTLEKDIAFKITKSIFRKYYEEYSALSEVNLELERLERLYMKGRMEMFPDSNFYPDANFTLRLSYGKVNDYSPGDAIHYNEMTTIKGIMEKEDRNNSEFFVPEKLKELYSLRDYGKYGKNDTMPVCFITDNDITGGSSGSPVLNSEGELMGIAFDGNWEAMSSDISYEPDLQRTICVDIRFVLFIIDKFAGSQRLIDELSILN